MENLTAQLYRSRKTVFTTLYLALLWQETNANNLKAKIAYYVRQGVLRRLSRGIFAKHGETYNPKELANSIYAPSYISFETVLREAGFIFQHYDTVFVAAPWSLSRRIDGHPLTFRKMKESILYNSAGVVQGPLWCAATPERAFLDMIYLYPRYYFDNLHSLNWEKCFELAPLYENRALIERLKKYQADYA